MPSKDTGKDERQERKILYIRSGGLAEPQIRTHLRKSCDHLLCYPLADIRGLAADAGARVKHLPDLVSPAHALLRVFGDDRQFLRDTLNFFFDTSDLGGCALVISAPE